MSRSKIAEGTSQEGQVKMNRAAFFAICATVGWPLARQRSILEQCFALLRADGVFLEFSYGPCSPVPRTLVKGLGLVACRLQRVWSNFPAATVWGYSRACAEP
jgi:phospholipid N-methyltransferase